MTARVWQVDGGSGPAWKEPPGEVGEFSEEDLDDDGKLDLDQDWTELGSVLEQLGARAPWDEPEEELEPLAVQRLATKLAPLSWAVVVKSVVFASADAAECLGDRFESFRLFVVDAARSDNGLAWEWTDRRELAVDASSFRPEGRGGEVPMPPGTPRNPLIPGAKIPARGLLKRLSCSDARTCTG